MNNSARVILIEVIQEYGSNICNNPILLRNILLDKCGQCHREIYLLISAMQERVHQDLELPLSIPVDVLLPRLAIKLQDHLSITAEAAHWTVESWGLALGVISPAELNALKAKTTAGPKTVMETVQEKEPDVHKNAVIPDGFTEVQFHSPWKLALIATTLAFLALSVVYFSYHKTASIKKQSSEKTVAISPEAPHEKEKGKTLIPKISEALSLFEQGNTFLKAGEYEKAAENFKQVIRLKPDYAEAYHCLGLTYYLLNRWQEAVTAFQQAVKFQPDLANYHAELGETFLKLERWQEASESFLRATHLNSEDYGSYYNLGVMYKQKLNRPQDAVQAYQQAIRIKPDFAVAYGNLGDAYSELNQLQEAARAYKQAIQIKPDFVVALCNLGNVYAELNRWTEAKDAYQQAIKFNSNYVNAHRGLGIVYAKLGKLNEAMQAFQQAIKLEPNDPKTHGLLGVVYLLMGNKNAASKEYEICKSLDPGKANEISKIFNSIKGDLNKQPGPISTRFTKAQNGVVTDNATGLDWYVGLNQGTIWEDAKAWTENLTVAGGNWRLPTVSELKALYQKGKSPTNLDPIFQTTGTWVWSGQLKDDSSAYCYSFRYGKEHWWRLDFSYNGRVFAVRSRQ